MKKLITVSLIFFAVLLTINISSAQPADNLTDDLNYCREKGVYSDNLQIRRESVYNIGMNNDLKSLPVLLERLKTEPDVQLRIFVARMIHRLDQVEGIKALEKTAWDDENYRIRWICRALCVDFAINNHHRYAFDLAALDKHLESTKHQIEEIYSKTSGK